MYLIKYYLRQFVLSLQVATAVVKLGLENVIMHKFVHLLSGYPHSLDFVLVQLLTVELKVPIDPTSIVNKVGGE